MNARRQPLNRAVEIQDRIEEHCRMIETLADLLSCVDCGDRVRLDAITVSHAGGNICEHVRRLRQLTRSLKGTGPAGKVHGG